MARILAGTFIALMCTTSAGLGAQTFKGTADCFTWSYRANPKTIQSLSDEDLKFAMTSTNPHGAFPAYRQPLHEGYCTAAFKAFLKESCRREPTQSFCK
jgi:hypothetical protein